MDNTEDKKIEDSTEYSDDGEYSDAEEPVTEADTKVENNSATTTTTTEARHYPPDHPPRAGDWQCPNCNANVFASKLACYKCRTPRPDGTGEVKPLPNIPRRPGDWQYVTFYQTRQLHNIAIKILT